MSINKFAKAVIRYRIAIQREDKLFLNSVLVVETMARKMTIGWMRYLIKHAQEVR